jgi:hypothetical protein
MASAVARAYSGGLGAPPPLGSRGKAPGGGSGGFYPLEADDILLLLTDLILMLKGRRTQKKNGEIFSQIFIHYKCSQITFSELNS